ncbi:unnamed protein product [Effrenium voratum]|uniref:Phospholipase/carboxylesterase/thioesterase domain-containing protein n=1 Tax=Effrenium voratum TaxID=2562239 RepID=A0AA36NGD2_9DINO|nr:unnamed protein product [Effrenium voratum]
MSDCFEKSELVGRVKDAMDRGVKPAASASSSASASATSSTASASGSSQFTQFGELLETPSLQPEEGVFIFLHGFGDSGRGFASQLPNLLQVPTLRYVLPTAPSMGGMRSWFGMGPGATSESIAYVHSLVRQQLARGVPADKIFLGGFSQGGCVAVRAALSFPQRLGGCVAASTFLSFGGRSPVTIAEPNRRLPVLCVHGEADGAVPLSSGQELTSTLRSQGVTVDFKSYPGMGHAYCPEEAADVAAFLRQRLRRPSVGGGRKSLEKLTAKELKALLMDAGISTIDCFEKNDLVEKALLL